MAYPILEPLFMLLRLEVPLDPSVNCLNSYLKCKNQDDVENENENKRKRM
jgi:hypothetical protein